MAHLIYALKDDVLTHVSDVERGLACGCKCPYCDEGLIARKGKKKEHHFAHQSGSDCEHAYESSLHLMAKEILSKAEKIFLPSVDVWFSNGPRWPVKLHDSMEVIIEKVELEKRFGNVIPDVVIYIDEKPLFVEIYVTHGIDDEKRDKLKELKIPVIEIYLKDIEHSITEKELSEILLGENRNKHWVYHPEIESYKANAYANAYELPMWWQGGDRYVRCNYQWVTCSVWGRCMDCENCIGIHNTYILCTHEPCPDDEEELEDEEESEPVKKPELVKEPKPIVLKEPEPEKPKKPKKIFQSFNDRGYKEKMKSLYEQMEREKKTVKPEPVKPASPSTIEVAMRILMEADYLTTPGKELHINSAELGSDLDIILDTHDESVHVVFSPNISDGHTRTLFIDLSKLDKFVTRKRFTEELINNVSVKQWLNEKAP